MGYSLPIQNICNNGREVYLFCRQDDGSLKIFKDNTFDPFYFEPDPNGKDRSISGLPLKKIYVNDPRDIKKCRSPKSWLSDLAFTKQYMIENVDEIIPSNPKIAFVDTEVLMPEFYSPEDNKDMPYPISCISLCNYNTKNIDSFFVLDFNGGSIEEKEHNLLDSFANHVKTESFDIVSMYNANFDYLTWFYRNKDIGKMMSPIGMDRWTGEGIMKPAGISILDYMGMFRKSYNKGIKSYALANIAKQFLGRDKRYPDVKFDQLDDTIKLRCEDDVRIMMELEDKFKIIPRFNWLRTFTHSVYEDLPMEFIKEEGKVRTQSNNSKPWESLLLKECKKRNLVAPSKLEIPERDEFEGAERSSPYKGRFFNKIAVDVASAYPQIIIDFCLDSSNYVKDPSTYDEPYQLVQIKDYYFKQNPEALLPKMVKKVLDEKNKLKKILKNTSVDSPSFDRLQAEYDATKAFLNTSYGSTSNRYFRFFDSKIAECTAFMQAEHLKFIMTELEKQNVKTIYYDTDGLILDTDKNITSDINKLVQKWANTYGKDKINLSFDYEGLFERIFIKATCNYVGDLRKSNGDVERKERGVEARRSDASKYISIFQRELIERILKNETEEQILAWVKQEIANFDKQPLEDIAFPCRLGRDISAYATSVVKDGKTINRKPPVFITAYLNSKNKFKMKKRIGDSYFYTYVEPEKVEETTTTTVLVDNTIVNTYDYDIPKSNIILEYSQKHPEIDKKRIKVTHKTTDDSIRVLAFDKETINKIGKIDREKMLERNIINKVSDIFDIMGWKLDI